MTWQTTTYKRVALELERHRVEAWLLHLDRLDLRRIEAASDGNSIHNGDSTCLSLALWWRERLVTLSFLIMPDRVEEICETVASAIEKFSIGSSRVYPAQSAPRWLEGVWNGWEGDWNSLADRWRPVTSHSTAQSTLLDAQSSKFRFGPSACKRKAVPCVEIHRSASCLAVYSGHVAIRPKE